MNFQSFWNQITKNTSLGKEYLTLSRKTPFTATFSNGVIIITPKKTKFERPLGRNEFSKVWQKAVTLSYGERYIQSNYHDVTFHASYILALMKSIIGDDQISQ